MRRPTVTPLLVLALAGCNTIQSPLDPASPQAQDLNRLFWIFVAVLGAIWLAVMVALALALRGAGRRTPIPSRPIPGGTTASASW
jgi:heme/copper-type cytochrome/quinol oxidase subunit 2